MSDRPTAINGTPIYHSTELKPVTDCAEIVAGEPCAVCGENDTPLTWTATLSWGSQCYDPGVCGDPPEPPTSIVLRQGVRPWPTSPCIWYGCRMYKTVNVPASSDPLEFASCSEGYTRPGYFSAALFVDETTSRWVLTVRFDNVGILELDDGSYCCGFSEYLTSASGPLPTDGSECTVPLIADTFASCPTGRQLTAVTITPGGTYVPSDCSPWEPDDPDPPPDTDCCPLCQPLVGAVDSETCVLTTDVCATPSVEGPERFIATFCGSMIPGFPDDLGVLNCYDFSPDELFLEFLEAREYECNPPDCTDPGYGPDSDHIILPPRSLVLRKTGTCRWEVDPQFNVVPNVDVVLQLTMRHGFDALPPSADDCVVEWNIQYTYRKRIIGAEEESCTATDCKLFVGAAYKSLSASTGACAAGTTLPNFYAQESVNPFFVLPDSCGCDAFAAVRLMPFNS